MGEKTRESNQDRTVHFGGVHFSDDTVGREKIGCSNAVEEIETVLVDGRSLQELGNTGIASSSEARDAEVVPSQQEQRNFLAEE